MPEVSVKFVPENVFKPEVKREVMDLVEELFDGILKIVKDQGYDSYTMRIDIPDKGIMIRPERAE